MKRLILVIIAIIALGLISFSLMSCGGFGNGDSDPGKNPPPQEDPVTDPDYQKDPDQQEEPDSDQQPGDEPGESHEKEPEENTEENPDSITGSVDKPKNYTIYTGQQLIIPIPDKGNTEESIVINAGTFASADKQIALTFDAGWLYDQTPALLNILDDYRVKATFFLRGKWAEDHPDLVKDIFNRGHSVENHSLTHGHMNEMTDEEVLNEMTSSTKIIEEITGYKPYLFRPPFGEYNNSILKILAQQGYPYTVKWTVDSLDWAEEMNGIKITEQYLIDRVLSNASDKGIVLMHVGGYQTVNALPEIIEGLRDMGYNLVKVNDMLPERSVEKQTIYTVKKGDTLSDIARKFEITIEDILKVNPAL